MAKHSTSHHGHRQPVHDHQASAAADTTSPKTIHGLSVAHTNAVLECARTITSLAPPAPPTEVDSTDNWKKTLEAGIAKFKGAPRKHFWNDLQKIEDQTNAKLYTPVYYQAQLDRAKYYTDIYVDNLPKEKLPAEGKDALKERFRAIIEGTAGMETGWDPKTVKGGVVRRPHTGVFQTSWEFIKQAREVFSHHPAMEAELNTPNAKQDLDVLKLGAKLKIAHGLPTTAFAGQGAAFAGMAVASYERFLAGGGSPQDFNGIIVYEDHMTGPTGAMRFRNKLQGPQKKGDSGVADTTYSGNYLITAHPYSGLNDFNPERLLHGQATASNVYAMLRDKFIFARNRLDATTGLFSSRVKAFEAAFLPEWSAHAELKEQDIARVKYERETGSARRTEAKDYAAGLAVDQHNAKHKTQTPLTPEQAQTMGLSAPAHPSAAQKEAVCSILLKPITPFTPRTPTIQR